MKHFAVLILAAVMAAGCVNRSMIKVVPHTTEGLVSYLVCYNMKDNEKIPCLNEIQGIKTVTEVDTDATRVDGHYRVKRIINNPDGLTLTAITDRSNAGPVASIYKYDNSNISTSPDNVSILAGNKKLVNCKLPFQGKEYNLSIQTTK